MPETERLCRCGHRSSDHYLGTGACRLCTRIKPCLSFRESIAQFTPLPQDECTHEKVAFDEKSKRKSRVHGKPDPVWVVDAICLLCDKPMLCQSIGKYHKDGKWIVDEPGGTTATARMNG